MSNEGDSYRTLKRNAFMPKDRVDRVENLVMAGMPDVNCCCDGKEAWIEIKTVTKDPVRKDTRLLAPGRSEELSQEQANWMLMQTRAGGACFVYIDAPSRRYLINGKHADAVNGSNQLQLMLMAEWTCPTPTPELRWAEIRGIIRASS